MHNSGQHLSKDMLDLIKSIGDSRSKQEEDKIILKEVDTLKVKMKESNINSKKMKEYLIRAIYIEMLGHDAPFSHFKAVNLTQDKNLMNKRVGYLASNLLLNENSECLIMLVSTLQKDIQSPHWIEICMALTTVVKFSNSTIMQAVQEPIIKLLENKSEHVRKKAVMCMHKFSQVNPSIVPDVNEKMRKMLCDYDPSVMGATLNYFKDAVEADPESYKDLVSSFVVIIKQVIEHKLPREFDYHRLPAPWIQIKILEILAILGRDDLQASEGMYEILTQVLRRADDTGINIGYAIVYQCVRTICIIYPNQNLLEQASNTISRFLSSDSPNLRCTGINGLTLIIQINPDYVVNHQQVIVDCLEENDETLKKNTFELLYKMTNNNNVEVIVERMMNYLKVTEVENSGRKDILFKITELSERFAPEKRWFIKIMNQLFVNFGNLITDDILFKLLGIINEWAEETDEDEFREFTIENYYDIIKTVNVLPDSLVQLVAWVFGEFLVKLVNYDEEKIGQGLRMLEYLINKHYDQDKTKCILISAITKIHSEIEFKEFDFVKVLMEKYACDKDVELQHRCLEYLRMSSAGIKSSSNIKVLSEDIEIDSKLSFLDLYVRKKISEGGKQYDRNKYDSRFGGKTEKGLNLTAYQAPETMFSVPGKNYNMQTKFYERNDDTQKKNINYDLKRKQEGKWTEKGFETEEKKVTPPVTRINNTSSVSNSNNNEGAKINAFVGDNRFSSISGGNKAKKEDLSNNKGFFNPQPKKEPVVNDPKKAEKDQLRNKLFGSLGGTANTNTTKESSSQRPHKGENFSTRKPKESKEVSKDIGIAKEVKETKPVDLLGFGTQEVPEKPNTQQTGLLDLGSTEPEKQTSVFDLDDIFGGTPKTSNKNPDFEIKSQSSTGNKQLKEFNQLQIDTDTFGEYWTNCNNDEFTLTINNPKIKTPEAYFSIISKHNIYPVQIINNEAISSAVYKNTKVLLHCTVEDSLTILVKTFDLSHQNELRSIIQAILN